MDRTAENRHVSKVTAKGQVTIPKEIRDRLGLRSGEYVVWEPRDEGVVMERARVTSSEDFEDLAERISERFSEKGITRDEVEDAIRWARERS